MAKKKKPLERPPEMDMLSFSAIMTILLAFFIMLSTQMKTKKADTVIQETASFRKAFNSYGLGSMLEGTTGGDFIRLFFEQIKVAFPEKTVENIHLEDDKEKNLLEEEVEFENVKGPTQTYIPTLIKFKPGDFLKLHPDGLHALDDFIILVADRPSKIIVEGRVSPNEIPKDDGYSDWYFSSLRAHTVAEYLTKGGIDVGRIAVVGYGKYRPLVEQSDDKDSDSFVSLVILNDK